MNLYVPDVYSFLCEFESVSYPTALPVLAVLKGENASSRHFAVPHLWVAPVTSGGPGKHTRHADFSMGTFKNAELNEEDGTWTCEFVGTSPVYAQTFMLPPGKYRVRFLGQVMVERVGNADY